MSQVAALLKQLGELGIRLFLDRGQLQFNAPKGVMTPALMTQLKANKDALIILLQQADMSSQTLTEPLLPLNLSGPVQLSYAQQRLWFLFNLEGATPTYNILLGSRFKGQWDVDVLTRSFQYLMMRHDCLRTTFTENSQGIAEQIVHDSLELNIERSDLSKYPQAEKEPLLDRLKQQLADSCFNLEVAPLARIALVRYSENEWVLLIAMHHIIGDGWSLGILSRELTAAYECFVNGREPVLPTINISYRDYSIWQQRPQQSQWIDQGVDQWCDLLENSEYRLDLPTGKPRPKTRTYKGAVCPVMINAELSRKLERLAETQGVSTFVVLLSVYFILLQRYSGRNDLLVGTQAANRSETALEAIVGFFINTLPLRGKLAGHLTFTELLTQVNQFCLQAFDLQYVPFERLVERLKPERDLGYNPLVQVMFLWQNAPIDNVSIEGLSMVREPIKSDAAKFDLTLELGMVQGRLNGVFEYSTDLFDAHTIENMVEHFACLLAGVAQNPKAAIGGLRLTADDLSVVTGGNLPLNDDTIVSAFNRQAVKTPDADAVNDGRQVLSYRQLSEQAEAIAQRLIDADIKAGAVVAIYLPRSNDYLAAILGILKAGCTYLPLEQTLPKARIDFILDDARAAAVISHQHELTGYRHIEYGLGNGAQLPPLKSLAEVAIPKQTAAYLIYTSGSTGQPKGVLISHQSVLGLVQSLNRAIYQNSPKPINVALMASFIFDASVQQIFAALLHGHCLHVCPSESRRDGQALLGYLQKQRIELSDCTPSLLKIMLDAGLTERSGLQLKQLIVGGEALPAQMVKDIAKSLEVFNVYGPTECTVDSTVQKVDIKAQGQNPVVSIGRPLANATIKIVDCYGNPQAKGLAGEIYISGEALAQGYHRQPALTAERFIPADNGQRWYRTGDQALLNPQGELEFLGRKDDQVKIRGYRIELGEIEHRLQQQECIQQAVVSVNKAESNELLAYIVVNGPVTVADLRKGLAQQLPDYMLPAHFIVLDRLPLNPAGKIDRKALPTLANAQRLSDDLGGAPKSEREQALAQVWCEVLGLESIGRDDNFFASGGDSIKALQIVSRVRKTGWKLEVRDLFTHSSISKLAPRLTLINEYLIADAEKPEGEVALSPIQQHFFQRHGRDYHHFNQAFLLEADAVDVEKLELALRLVCVQHDSFRLRFKQQNRQWQQAYAETETFEFTVQALLSLQDLSAHAAKLQQSFDLSNGVLFKVVFYRLPEKCYLLLVAHHLIIDAVSWRILMEDLNEAYEQGEQWQAPAPTLSMKAWSRYCRLQGKKIIEEQQSYWRQQTITPNMDEHDVDYASLDSIKIELDAVHSELFLTGVHQAYATEANDLLLTALLLAYNQWTQESVFSLILEGHGRDVLEGADVSRTIGWFTTRYPVVLHYEQAKDLGYTIKSVKENLRAIANKGVGYGLLRYMIPEVKTHLFKDPAISFNYLGQFGEQQQGRFSIANEAIGDIISPEASSPYLIEFVGKHVAGRLTFEIAYSRAIYKKQQIDDFSQSFKDALIKIIAHTANAETQSLSPSDIDYDGFDISQLDDFMAQL